jgi:hypothetical protein
VAVRAWTFTSGEAIRIGFSIAALDLVSRCVHHSVMIRRSISSLVVLLMLNVLALGDGLFALGGSACDRMNGTSAQMNGMADMPGMDLGKGSSHDEHRDSAPKGGCNLPWAQGCTSTAPCGPVATTVATNEPQQSVERLVAPLSLGEARAPDSPALAPELPPPKALTTR